MRWYVYRIIVDGVVGYIGKGSGRRVKASAKRLRGAGEIIQRFKSERDAIKEEIRLIAQYQPPFNKTKGGEGGSKKREPRDPWPRWRREAYEWADKPTHPIFQLGAAAFARCELNSRGIRCPEEASAQELADPVVAEAVRRLSNWLQWKRAGSHRLSTC